MIVIASGVFCRKLIGRAKELTRLVNDARYAAERRSCLIVIRGEAGVGKTRLLGEFIDTMVRTGRRGIVA